MTCSVNVMLSYNMSIVLDTFSLSMRLLPWLSLTNAANYSSSKSTLVE